MKARKGEHVTLDKEGLSCPIFDHMPHIEPGTLKLLDVFPLEKAEAVPDIVIVEDTIEKLMWLTLAYLHATGGERVSGTTAVLQAVCADSTIIPYCKPGLARLRIHPYVNRTNP